MTLGPTPGSGVARFLRSMRRRLRLVWAWATASLLAPAVAGVVLLLVLIGRWRPWGWPEPMALIIAVLAAVLLLVVAVVQPLSWLSAARAADRGLAARDIFTSALQFRDLDNEFGEEIRNRAERLADDGSVATAVPFPADRPTWIRLALAGVLAVVTIVLAVMANPQDAERERLEMVEARADELAEAVEALADEVAIDEPDQSELTAALVADLDALADELRDVDNLEEAARLLDNQAEQLADRRSPDFRSQQAAAQGLERSLATRPLPGEPSGTASEQLAEMAAGLDELSRPEQEELAERLAQLAEAQAAGNPAASAALADAAQQLAAGDTAGAEAVLGEAAAAVASNAAAVAGQQAEAEAAGQLANLASRAEAEAQRSEQNQGAGEGQGAGPGQGSGTDGGGQGQGAGQGQGQGEGQGQGQGQGQGEGQGQAGSGAQGNVTGAAGGSDGSAQGGVGRPDGGDQPRIEGDNSGFTIVDPAALVAGDPLDLGGTLTGDGQTETAGQAEGPTSVGQSRIPVSEVVGDYSRRAAEAVDRTQLSPSQQELVGNYFDRLTTGGS